jgi:hypothetical protein
MAVAYLGNTLLGQQYLGNTEIYEVNLRNPQFTTSSLYAYYDFNNPTCYPGSGSIVFDLSGNGNNLTISGSVTYNTEGGIEYFSWNTSSLGRLTRPAISSSAFTGTGITVTSFFRAQSNRLTVQDRGIVNVALSDDDMVGQSIVDIDLSTKRSAYNFLGETPDGGGLALARTTQAYRSSVKNNVDEWVVLSNTYSNGSVTPKFYVDSSEITDTEVVTGFGNIRTGSFTIDVGVSQQAYNFGEYYWFGDISIVAVYNTVLSEQQIYNNYISLYNTYLK